MQPLAWSWNRLRAMSASEIRWRAAAWGVDAADRVRHAVGYVPPTRFAPGVTGNLDVWQQPGFRVFDDPVGFAVTADGADRFEWVSRLRRRADRLSEHRLSFFSLADAHLGEPIDWNRDHEHGRPAPVGFSASIDYRDFSVTGDAKVVWEPNRHHHLVVLARAFRATGDVRYALAVLEQLESWLVQCPYGTGMNWRSPLELGIRLINWVWAVDLIRDSGLVSDAMARRLTDAVYLHLLEVSRKYSQASSANNHRIGEAAGVFIASSYFSGFAQARQWREESRRILADEITAQSYPDGCTREHAFGYHLFVLQFFIVAEAIARRTGGGFGKAYCERLGSMAAFAEALAEAGGQAPLFGDSDDGYVLDLGSGDRMADTLGMAAAVVRETTLPMVGTEPAVWLGVASNRLKAGNTPGLRSQAFEDAGYYLLQCEGPERISVFIDCAELGYGSIAAHGHADALNIAVRAFGCDVLVDPGTFDYFTHPEWRRYLKSTRAHNTLELDGCDQSEMLGPFLWGRRAKARRLAWEPRQEGGMFSGEHDGYRSLVDPATHRRTVQLDGHRRALTLRDEVIAEGPHEIALNFHFSPDCRIVSPSAGGLTIDVGGIGTIRFDLDARLSITTSIGKLDPIDGWVSPGYHRRVPAPVVTARGSSRGTLCYESRLTFEMTAEKNTEKWRGLQATGVGQKP